MDKRTRVLNHELDLTFPDSFHPLSKEELAGLQNPAGAEGAAFSDPDDHILFSVGWKPPSEAFLRRASAISIRPRKASQ